MTISRYFTYIGASLVVAACSTIEAPHQDVSAVQVTTEMFEWWNDTYVNGAFTVEGFSNFYSDDTVFKVNDRDAIVGLESLTEHFARIQAAHEFVEIELPFKDSFEADGRAFAHYTSRSISQGETGRSVAMGYIDVEDGKIVRLHILQNPVSD
jgi:SnoaL-like protein